MIIAAELPKQSANGGKDVKFRIRLLNVMTWCFLAVLGVDAGAQGKAEKDKIRIGYAARAVAHSVPYMAKEAGFFAEEGIEVEVVKTAGNVAPMALVSGDVDFSIMSAFLLIPVSLTEIDKSGYIDRLCAHHDLKAK